jgi:TonB family protein
MDRIQFIHQPSEPPGNHAYAIAASCAFHVLTLGGLLGMAFYYQSHAEPPVHGSAAGAPTIVLETMVVAPAPPERPPVPSPALTPPTVSQLCPPSVAKQIECPVAPVKLPDEGVPVLPLRMSQSALAKTDAPHHTTSHTATPSSAKPAAAAAASSYAPGENLLPHPPYPTEAQNRGLMGTVEVNVQFDTQGGVASVVVTHSSGVAVLDVQTRSFIRTNWHCPSFAGQLINVPVKYHLE